MPTCYQLVGIPGSGKTTWIKSQPWTKDCVVVSTDDIIEAYAKEIGSTYSGVFESYMSTAIKLMADQVVQARNEGKNIIWDQTSVSVKSRKRKFTMLPNYKHIAVVFETPVATELRMRLASRPGKNIPWSVVSSMIRAMEMPTIDEGFTEIRIVSQPKIDKKYHLC